jgi:hypothetical protein
MGQGLFLKKPISQLGEVSFVSVKLLGLVFTGIEGSLNHPAGDLHGHCLQCPSGGAKETGVTLSMS